MVEKLAHFQGKWLLCDWRILVRSCIFKAQNQQPLLSPWVFTSPIFDGSREILASMCVYTHHYQGLTNYFS